MKKHTQTKATRGEPVNPRAREHYRNIKALIPDPRFATAGRFGAAVLALTEEDPTMQNPSESRRWLEALGLTPATSRSAS